MKFNFKNLVKKALRRIGLWSIEEKIYVKQYQSIQGESLKNRNVLITGGTSGIGLAIAKRCIKEGANVVITGRNEEKLKKTLSQDDTGQLKGLIWDVSDIHVTASKLEQVRKLFEGDIDVLVNNAGISIRQQPGTFTEEVWEMILKINLTAPVFLSQEVSKAWINSNKNGVILNISSMAGLEPSLDAYSVAKCGLNSMTKGMARVWASEGIRVNALAVGVTIGTELRDIQRNHTPDGDLKCSWIPIGRFAVPDEIAETATYLITERAAYITGAVVECDGAGSISFGS
jgi:NAD(P)-dependent dehydrogenase (short-subunit alcohol dehydrogenase family)